jgi:hypothetical protein
MVRSASLRAVALAMVFIVGCSSGLQRAAHTKQLICLGMHKEEIRERIGPPSAVRQLKLAPGSEQRPIEEWSYQYSSTNAGHIFGVILVTVVVVALVVVVVAVAAGGKGGGGGLNFGGLGGGGGGGSTNTWTFSLVFDANDRVKAISDVQRIK